MRRIPFEKSKVQLQKSQTAILYQRNVQSFHRLKTKPQRDAMVMGNTKATTPRYAGLSTTTETEFIRAQ